METALAQYFTCPHCHGETPHFVLIRRGDRVGVECTNCHTISLARQEQLIDGQLLWEEELRQILISLETPDLDPD